MREWYAPANIIPYSFEEVCSVFWSRYPNSFAKHIVSEDVLDRKITEHTIHTKKLIVKQGSSILKRVPRWLSKMTDIRIVPVIEESLYDKRTKTLTTFTRNVSHNEMFYLHERVLYRPSVTDADSVANMPMTELQRAVTLAFNMGRMSSVYEKITLMGFKKSIQNTMKGYAELLQQRFGSHETVLQSVKMSQKLKQKLLQSHMFAELKCEDK